MRRNVGQKQQRRRQAAFTFVEVVLGNPGAVKTVAFGVADLFCCQTIALFRRGVVKQAGEKSQAFSRHANSSVAGEKWGMAAISSRV
jgi:hypothetical protein